MKFFFALISAKRPPEKIGGRLRSWNLAIKNVKDNATISYFDMSSQAKDKKFRVV